MHGDVSQGTLFRIEAAAAAATALLLVVLHRRWVLALAWLVAVSAFGAVMLYRYADVGALGPLPDMYEPFWYAEKTVSAVAEGVAALLLSGVLLGARAWRR